MDWLKYNFKTNKTYSGKEPDKVIIIEDVPESIFKKVMEQPDTLDGKTPWQRILEEAKAHAKANKEDV